MTNRPSWILTSIAIAAMLSVSQTVNADGDIKKPVNRTTVSDERARAEAATDRLTEKEENLEMPLPGQGYSHSSLLLDKAKDKKAIEERLEQLENDGKIKSK